MEPGFLSGQGGSRTVRHKPSGADPGGTIARLAARLCKFEYSWIFSSTEGIIAGHRLPAGISSETAAGFAVWAGVNREFVCDNLAAVPGGGDLTLLKIPRPPASCALLPIPGVAGTALCAFSATPRTLDAEEIESLRDLARLTGVVVAAPPGLELDSCGQRYREIFENTTDIVFTQDLDGRITAVNSAACQATGWSRAELVGRSGSEWWHPDCADQVRNMLLNQYGGGAPRRCDLRIRRKDGGHIDAEVVVNLLFEKGQPCGIMGFAQDLSEQREADSARLTAEAELNLQGKKVEELTGYLAQLYRLDQTYHDGLAELAEDCLRTGCEVLGMEAGYVFHLKPGEQSPDLESPFASYSLAAEWSSPGQLQLAGALSGSGAASVRDLETRDPQRTIEVASSPVKVAGRNWGVACLLRRKRPGREFGGGPFLSLLCARLGERISHEELSEARRDPLTGLLNSSGFTRRLNRQLSKSSRSETKFAVALLDLDLFAHFNQRFGFEAGDEFLHEVGVRLQNEAREGEVIGRLGADRFALIIPASAGFAGERGNSFLKAIRAPLRKRGQEVSVTASLGMAFFPGHDSDAQGLIRCADRALLQAKARGRNAADIFSPEQHAAEKADARIEVGMHDALSSEEFRVRFQPQIGTNGELRGFEALLAWDHPERGEIPAAQFVARAEETGLIVPIGEWVIRKVVRQMAAWRDAGLDPVIVAVNISPIQFERPRFVDLVLTVLKEHRIEPERLELEVTENTVMRDAAKSTVVMERIRRLGVRLAIDDFGTGYSSLSYLNRLPVHALKIDRSFLSETEPTENTRSTLNTITKLAHSLGLLVVGEGVERLSQLHLLEDAGCDIFQGHLFGHPMNADSAARLLSKRTAALVEGGSAIPRS